MAYNGKERIILFVGRMEDIKGGHFLVRTFMKVLEDYPESRLMIIGDGNYDLFCEMLNRSSPRSRSRDF